MTTEREARTVTEHLDAWARTFRVQSTTYDIEAAAADDPYLKGMAAGYYECFRALAAASTDIKYRRRDGFKLREVK